MTFQYTMLTPELVSNIHSEMELLIPGFNMEGTLDFVFDRIDNFPEDAGITPVTAREKIEYMAAYLLFHLIEGHPFADGNKRTAFLSFGVLLAINNLYANYSEEKVRDRLELLYRKLEEHKQFEPAFNDVFSDDKQSYEFELIRLLFELGGARGAQKYADPLAIYPVVKTLISDTPNTQHNWLESLISRFWKPRVKSEEKPEKGSDA